MAIRDNNRAFNLCERLMESTATTKKDVYKAGLFNESSVRPMFSRKEIHSFTDVCKIAYICGFTTIDFGTGPEHEVLSISIADYLGVSDKKVELLRKRASLRKELERVEKEIKDER